MERSQLRDEPQSHEHSAPHTYVKSEHPVDMSAEIKPEHAWAEGQDGHVAVNDDNVAALASLAATYRPGSDEEKALVRKIDIRILPCIWGLYTLSYLGESSLRPSGGGNGG